MQRNFSTFHSVLLLETALLIHQFKPHYPMKLPKNPKQRISSIHSTNSIKLLPYSQLCATCWDTDEENNPCSNHLSYKLASTLISGTVYIPQQVEGLMNGISLFEINSLFFLSVQKVFTNSLPSKFTNPTLLSCPYLLLIIYHCTLLFLHDFLN